MFKPTQQSHLSSNPLFKRRENILYGATTPAWGGSYSWLNDEPAEVQAYWADRAPGSIPTNNSPVAKRRARRQTKAKERASPENDDLFESKPFKSWVGRTFEFETDGPFAVDLRTTTQWSDGKVYEVEWLGLDSRGAVIPEIRSDGDTLAIESFKLPAKQSALLPDPNSREGRGSDTFAKTHYPPVKSDNGYRVRVTVPPQKQFNGNSAGVDLNIHGRKGNRIWNVPDRSGNIWT